MSQEAKTFELKIVKISKTTLTHLNASFLRLSGSAIIS